MSLLTPSPPPDQCPRKSSFPAFNKNDASENTHLSEESCQPAAVALSLGIESGFLREVANCACECKDVAANPVQKAGENDYVTVMKKEEGEEEKEVG